MSSWRVRSSGNGRAVWGRWQPAWLLACVAMILATSGCETLNAPMKDAQTRQKRNEALVRDMNQRRDAAEILAARERLQRGQLAEARQILAQLLVRTPEQAEAKALLDAVTHAERQLGQQRAVVQASATGVPASGAVRIPAESPASGAVKPVGASSNGNDDHSTREDTARIRGLLGPAESALREGSTETGLGRIREACATNPQDPQIPISAAGLLLRHRQPAGAVEVLREAAGRFPSSAAVHRMLGTAYYRAGDLQAAQVAFQQSLSLDKSSALSYFLMGCTLVKLGQTEAAAAHFRQAEMLDPRYGVGH